VGIVQIVNQKALSGWKTADRSGKGALKLENGKKPSEFPPGSENREPSLGERIRNFQFEKIRREAAGS